MTWVGALRFRYLACVFMLTAGETEATCGNLVMAIASSTVRFCCVPVKTPPVPRRPGRTTSRLVPSASNCAVTCACAPAPSAIIAITAPTPMMMPSIARSERILFAMRLLKALMMMVNRKHLLLHWEAAFNCRGHGLRVRIDRRTAAISGSGTILPSRR